MFFLKKFTSFNIFYSNIFAIANWLPGFPISILANVKDFLNGNIFFKCKLNINVGLNDYSFKYICVVC